MKPFITKSSNLDLLQMSPFIRASLMIVPIKNKISSPCPFQNQGLKNYNHLSFTVIQVTYSSAIQEKNTTFEIDSEAMVNPAQK